MRRVVLLIVMFLSASTAVWAEEASTPAVPAAPERVAKSLYDRLGGESGIRSVVDDFVAKAAADPAVNFTRQGKKRTWEASEANVKILEEHLVQFLCMATGGNQTYAGKSMEEAHADLEITDAEFDAIASVLKASLVKFNIGEQEQQELLGIAGTTRGVIVMKKAEAQA